VLTYINNARIQGKEDLKGYKDFEIERDFFFNKLGVLIDGDFKSSFLFTSVYT
jgi:hypothetical protein